MEMKWYIYWCACCMQGTVQAAAATAAAAAVGRGFAQWLHAGTVMYLTCGHHHILPIAVHLDLNTFDEGTSPMQHRLLPPGNLPCCCRSLSNCSKREFSQSPSEDVCWRSLLSLHSNLDAHGLLLRRHGRKPTTLVCSVDKQRRGNKHDPFDFSNDCPIMLFVLERGQSLKGTRAKRDKQSRMKLANLKETSVKALPKLTPATGPCLLPPLLRDL